MPSRFLDELPVEGVERERLRAASWTSVAPAVVAPRDDVPSLSTGDSVRHGTLGEGVVTRIEAGGVATLRLAPVGGERRAMFDHLPLVENALPRGDPGGKLDAGAFSPHSHQAAADGR